MPQKDLTEVLRQATGRDPTEDDVRALMLIAQQIGERDAPGVLRCVIPQFRAFVQWRCAQLEVAPGAVGEATVAAVLYDLDEAVRFTELRGGFKQPEPIAVAQTVT